MGDVRDGSEDETPDPRDDDGGDVTAPQQPTGSRVSVVAEHPRPDPPDGASE